MLNNLCAKIIIYFNDRNKKDINFYSSLYFFYKRVLPLQLNLNHEKKNINH